MSTVAYAPRAAASRLQAISAWIGAAAPITILWAFACSLEIYKVWYIYTAIVAIYLMTLAYFGAVRIGRLPIDAIPIAAYFLWLPTTSLYALNPHESLVWSIVDSIFFVVFCLAYVSGMNSRAETISRVMVGSIVPLWLSALYFAPLSNSSRFGLRAYEVAPFIIPFAVARSFERSWVAKLALALTLVFLVLTQTKTPLAAGLVALAASILWMAPRFLQALRYGILILAIAGGILLVALQFPAVQVAAGHTWTRITGQKIEVNGNVILPEPADAVRLNITELSSELLSRFNVWGIGYENFQDLYQQRYGEPVVLHSMYATWTIETGAVSIVLIVFILVTFFRQVRFGLLQTRQPAQRNYWKAITVGFMVALLAGIFQQAHQSPALWTVLGLAAGAANRLRILARTSGMTLNEQI